jgi:signal transduction histidine kinase
MRFRTWPVAALGAGSLLLLVVLSVWTASQRAQGIFTQLDALNSHHRDIETKIRRLRSDVHLSSIYIRDYLLDRVQTRAPEYRNRIAEFRETSRKTLDELSVLARRDGWDHDRTGALRLTLEQYWQAFEPLFDWSPAEKQTQSAAFLQAQVVPRREAVLAMTQQMEEMNNANMAAQRDEVTRRHTAFRRDLDALMWQSLLLGIVVAVVAVLRLRVLERRAERDRAVTEEAERQMRELSQRLVATQEEERRKLSRELHDHVGQMLTALRMELGRVERLKATGGAHAADAIAASRAIIDDMVRTVRDLALGLRPSMLDDFGLQPALEWHVRDFTRRYGLEVDLRVRGQLETVREPHRTCVYRVVQEALTNCVRHAQATHVEIRIAADTDLLSVFIEDNGVGLDPRERRTGLGLRGLEERVRELGGTVHISGSAGVRLAIRLPYSTDASEVPRAAVAG